MRMTGFARHRSYSTRPARQPYESRKRSLIAHFTDNPPSSLSSGVIRCYYHEGMTMGDTAEILQVLESDVKFTVDCLIQDSQ